MDGVILKRGIKKAVRFQPNNSLRRMLVPTTCIPIVGENTNNGAKK
jgi:hypothetical protein